MTLPTGVPPLRELYVYVTDGCNCRCRHCWIVPRASSGSPPAFLEPEVLEKAVGEALPLGLTSIKWTGGEPTIHPRFEELLDAQRRHGLGGRMETNAMAVTPALAGLLAASRVSEVSVSIDAATPETHDAIRGVEGAHRRSLRGFEALRGAGFKPQLIMSLMRDNAGELEKLLELAASVGAGSVKLNVVQPILGGKELHGSGGALAVPEVLDVERRLDGGLRARFPFPIFLDIPLAFRPLTSLFEGRDIDACGILGILGLLADGTWALCGIGTHERKLSFGRVGQEPLAAIWEEHPVLRSLREGLPAALEGVCGRCFLAAACLGNCVAMNYHRAHRLLAPYWFCEDAERLGLFPPTRLKDAGKPYFRPAGSPGRK